ncbi:transporter substrate-binding domain-containing protein [Undibacterium jejuense]|uniref:Transporter substrate-binding domain-containing protein n=1 Tax=Undibacterium jejuense TaxID=1344949 RepID=A0A923KK77_9BURK|nr:transporter substrate-binding domain-containing protein [Undibacterium jejuense]MBC3861555.1 transporter substrate-binding domain-containing protein [Undibacterium jejuense]
MKAIARLTHLLLLIVILVTPVYSRAKMTRVIYPANDVHTDKRFDDVIEILHTALEKTKAKYGKYECIPSSTIVPKKRSIQELEQNAGEINVIWNPTSEEMEKKFLVIRIPLRKGLLGYRIPLIRKEDQSKFDQIKTEDDLKKFTVGQGIDWVDIPAYTSRGITVIQAPYVQLSAMLANNRFDMFPRGVGEILPEYEQYHELYPDIVIEKNLLIYYPFPYYFFFNPADRQLKERIEAGLNIMRKDGSFDAIFNKYYQVAIKQLNVKKRRLIKLSNPALPKDTPLDESDLWYAPHVR